MSFIILPKNTAKDAVLVEVKSGTTIVIDDSTPVEVNVQQPVSIDDNSGSITVDDGGVPLSVDDGGGSLTFDNPILSVVGGGTEATAQRVTLANDSTGVVSVDDNGASITVDTVVTSPLHTLTSETDTNNNLLRQDVMESILVQMKIMNAYNAIGFNETLTAADTEE